MGLEHWLLNFSFISIAGSTFYITHPSTDTHKHAQTKTEDYLPILYVTYYYFFCFT